LTKPEIETVLAHIGHLNRIKIFQKATEKKSSVFVSFKTISEALKARNYLTTTKNLFNEMTEDIQVEYPTQDISRKPPVFVSANPAGLSKKARKLLAAENRIAYCRNAEEFDQELLYKDLQAHGPCSVYIIRETAPSTAFVVFETPAQCSAALLAKTMGCNLPRHKRVDFKLINESEDQLKEYLKGVGEIKNISLSEDICTIEFLTALGAAKAIVLTKQIQFLGRTVDADYSPSIKEDESISSHLNEDTLSRNGCPDEFGSGFVGKVEAMSLDYSETITCPTYQVMQHD
jgi:RNA recognition motif-containing protein